jgi:hypothetical protein
MVSYAISNWHHTRICHCYITSGPYGVNRHTTFAPSFLAVNSPTMSFIPRPCRSIESRLNSPLYMFLFASKHKMSCSPFLRHCFILHRRSSLNRNLGHVSSLSFLIKCLRYCWCTVPKSFFLLAHGDYLHMTCVVVLLSPLNFMYVHHPRPRLSRPDFSGSNCWIKLPCTIISVPPS